MSSEKKSPNRNKSISPRKTKTSFKTRGTEGLDSTNSQVKLAKRKESLETEAQPNGNNSCEKNKMAGISTVDGAIQEEKGDSGVPDLSPENKSGRLPDIQKLDVCTAVGKWQKLALNPGSKQSLYEVVQAVPSEYFARARGSEIIKPTVNGLRQFGLSKGKISRVIVKFSSPPTPHPLTVCFHFPSTFLTHRHVLDMIRTLLSEVEGARVTSIQFVDRNTIHGARGLDNRWLVTVNKAGAMDVILRHGLQLFSRRVVVRKYDDILREEYNEFLEYMQIRRQLYIKTEDNAIREQPEARTSAEMLGSGQLRSTQI